MVQVIEPTRIGTQLGEALQRGAAAGSELGMQRGMLKQSLADLANLPQNASAFDLAKSLIGATAGIPGAEKYVGQLFPLLLQQMRGKALFGGSQPPVGLPKETGTIPGSPPIISAEDIQKKAQEYAAMGGDPNEVLSYFDAQNKLATQQQEQYRDAVAQRIGTDNPSDLAIAQRIGLKPQYSGISDPRLKADLVAKEMQKYQAARDAFGKDAAERPNPLLKHQAYENKIKGLKATAKHMIDAGQFDEAYQLLAQKGWKESEIANILNPLPAATKAEISKLPKFHPFSLVSQESREKSLKSSQRLEKDLERLIKPGEVNPNDPNFIKPGTSLLLLRNEFLKKGIPDYVFDATVNRMIADGRINLDPTQIREKQILSDRGRSFSLWETLFGPQ